MKPDALYQHRVIHSYIAVGNMAVINPVREAHLQPNPLFCRCERSLLTSLWVLYWLLLYKIIVDSRVLVVCIVIIGSKEFGYSGVAVCSILLAISQVVAVCFMLLWSCAVVFTRVFCGS